MSKADNKIRIIDLLNKIANKEELPKKIKYESVFELQDGLYLSIDDNTCRFADYLWCDFSNINEEVEILEDNTEEIEELKRTQNVYDMTLECYHDIEKKISNDELADKINEIIRYIKRKDKNNE